MSFVPIFNEFATYGRAIWINLDHVTSARVSYATSGGKIAEYYVEFTVRSNGYETHMRWDRRFTTEQDAIEAFEHLVNSPLGSER